MPELFVRCTTPLTRLALHPLAITETTCTGTLPLEISRKTPVGVVSVIAVHPGESNVTVNFDRTAVSRRRLARQDTNAW